MLDSTNGTVTSFDVAATLKNEQGTFLAQRAGQTSVIECKPGHSIVSWVPVGTVEPSVIPYGTNPPYIISRLPDTQGLGQPRSNQQTSAQGDISPREPGNR